MTSTNCSSGVIIRSITYRVTGSTGTEYAVSVDPVDQTMRCSCRAGQFGKDCRHQRAVREGNAGKPLVRVGYRPHLVRPRSPEMEELITRLDV